MKNIITVVLLAAAGLTVWLGIQAVSGVSEAWDSSLYFMVGIPLMALACGAAGYLSPEKWWAWGPTVVLVQLLTMIVAHGVGGMIIFGVVLFGIIAIPCTFVSYMGMKLHMRSVAPSA